MSPLTEELLNRVWEGNTNFSQVAHRLKAECRSMAPAEAAIIGKDLIMRRNALDNPLFKSAAYLATESEAGNDGYLDFIDCALLLPVDRYERIIDNPDNLIDDPIAKEFDEFHLLHQITQVFDKALLEEGDDGLLEYLICDKSNVGEAPKGPANETVVKESLPRLYAIFGKLLKKRTVETTRDSVKLDELIPEKGNPEY